MNNTFQISISTFLLIFLFTSCKKNDTPPTTDLIVGRWAPKSQIDDQNPGQQDYIQYNADGTGLDTRLIGTNTYVIGFSWTINSGDNLTSVTTSGPSGHYSYMDGSYHIVSINTSMLIVQDLIAPYYIDTLLKQ